MNDELKTDNFADELAKSGVTRPTGRKWNKRKQHINTVEISLDRIERFKNESELVVDLRSKESREIGKRTTFLIMAFGGVLNAVACIPALPKLDSTKITDFFPLLSALVFVGGGCAMAWVSHAAAKERKEEIDREKAKQNGFWSFLQDCASETVDVE